MQKPKMSSITALKWMLTFAGRYKLWFSLSVLATGALIAVNLVQAWFVKTLVDRALAGDLNRLPGLVALFLAAVVGGTGLSYLRTRCTGRYSEAALQDIRNRLGEKMSAISFTALKEIQAGDMASRVNNDTETIGKFMKQDLPGIAMHILMGLAAAGCIAALSWKLLAAALSFTPLAMMLAYWLNTSAGRHYPLVYELTGKAAGELEQAITGRELIRSYNLQQIFTGKFSTLYQEVFNTEMRAQKYVAILQPVCFALVYFPRLLCVLYGGYLVFSGNMEVGTVAAVLQLLEYLVVPTVMLPFFMNNIKRSTAAIERVAEAFDLPQERRGGAEVPTAAHPEPVRFTAVSFSYPQGGEVLSNISFSLKRGTVTALAGASGSGKTTIANLMAGLMDCRQGKIELFGMDIKTLNPQALREKLAVVSQHTYLFPGTIAENIGYGRAGEDIKEIIGAARAACAHDFISAMPQGYDTRVGEGGASLSGGERQRIAIARAILRDAPVVVLDEPTSALDNQAEAAIQESIARLAQGRTVLLITHRLSTMAGADRIIVMDSGRVAETGTQAELLQRRGHYYKLCHTQFSA